MSKDQSFYLTVLLFSHEGFEEDLRTYEKALIPVLEKHQIEILFQVNPAKVGFLLETAIQPTEIHLLKVPSQKTLELYLQDETRTQLRKTYQHAIKDTITIKGQLF